MDKLTKLKARLGSSNSKSDDTSPWELSEESNFPYEPMPQQTEAINNLYFTNTGAVNNIDNEVTGVKVIPPTEAAGSFGEFAELPSPTVTSQPTQSKNKHCSNARLAIIAAVVVALVIVVAVAVPLMLKHHEEQALDHSGWVVFQANMTVTQWNYTQLQGATAQHMTDAFQTDLCYNIRASLSDVLQKVYKDCELNHFLWDYSRGQGAARYSLYLELPKSFTERDLREMLANEIMVAVQTENSNSTPSFQFLKADPNTLTFDKDEDDCIGAKCEHECVDRPFTHECTCHAGYALKENDQNCDDVDECKARTHKCNHQCVNKPGGYICTCNTGYQLTDSHFNCTDIDECKVASSNNNCMHVCNNQDGAYNCSCKTGFTLNSDGFTCDDVDECAANIHGCAQSCNNTIGAFQCGCNAGFAIETDKVSCKDVNECETNNGGCLHDCVNTAGSYNCSCFLGHALLPDRQSCQDVDECLGSHACQQECINTLGAYSCGCFKGYAAINATHCRDVNECQLSVGQRCQQRCLNTQGSYSCVCAVGFRLHSNGTNCTDVNECQEGSHECENFCINTYGSHTCSDIDLENTCETILLNGDKYYQTLRQGIYELLSFPEFECDEREVYRMSSSGGGGGGSDMFLYYAAFTGRWLVSGTMCSVMAGIRSAPNTTYPTDAKEGDWNTAFSRKWINSSLSATCLKDEYDCEHDDHPCEHECLNVDGFGYSCVCSPGFNMTLDRHGCQDFDECLVPDICNTPYCLNTEGSYQCVDADVGDMCPRLRYVTGDDNYQAERAGTYSLHLNATCGGRPVWKQAGKDNYLYYIPQAKFWVVGEEVCGVYVGVLVEGNGVSPWEVAQGEWKHWNGSHWIPTSEMSFKCVAEGCAEEEEFMCTNGACVPINYVCDGAAECEDLSDELGCPCDDDHVQCDNGQCVGGMSHSTAVDWCDGIVDCIDGSDEKPDCACLPDVQFYCESANDTSLTRKCINAEWKCDGDNDCGNYADEYGCECRDYEWGCPNTGLCISPYWRCDGEDDCGDWSDEHNCTCESEQFQCNMGACISGRAFCNGQPDCPDGSDELDNCSCMEGLFQCGSGECILMTDHCDGFYDCADNVDETHCDCPSYLRTCDNGNCYYPSWHCDGDNDCGDYSDENNCECTIDAFRCNTSGCTHGNKDAVYCSGMSECTDGSDEPDGCECLETQMECGDNCASKTLQCDGTFDCPNGSDENGCACEDNEMRCANELCINNITWCNGRNDCGDWSDETKCTCNEDQVHCENGFCIQKYQWCNGVANCPDDSDEKANCTCLESQHRCGVEQGSCINSLWVCDNFPDCPDGSDEYPHQTCECREDEQQCADGQCIAARFWCNTRINCRDLSDETNCTCDVDSMFRCANNVCISKLWQCDDDNDCHDLSDERECPCREDENGEEKFRCYSDAQCIPHAFECDGLVDCPEAEDEANCHNCSANAFVCSDYTCVSDGERCNGHTDCPDHSDEFNCVREDYRTVEVNGARENVTVLSGYSSSDDAWLPFCATGWTAVHSDIACRQLGHSVSSETYFLVDRRDSTSSYLQPTSASPFPTRRLHELLSVVEACGERKVVSVQCHPLGCGTRTLMAGGGEDDAGSAAAAFVINGQTALPGAWPWVVAVSAVESGSFFCGGTLINDRWVLTSAHCLEDEDDVSKLRVRLGTVHRQRADPAARTLGVLRAVPHPAFVTDARFDAVLLELDNASAVAAAMEEGVVRALCLPPENDADNFAYHRQCAIAGWGERNKNVWYPWSNMAEVLQESRMLLLSPERCTAAGTITDDDDPYVVHANVSLCAGFIDGHTAGCDGDSGSPLMCENEAGVWTLAGVLMMGSTDCDTYNVFVNVSVIVPWIHDTVLTFQNDGSTDQPPVPTPRRSPQYTTSTHQPQTTDTLPIPRMTPSPPRSSTPQPQPPATPPIPQMTPSPPTPTLLAPRKTDGTTRGPARPPTPSV